MAASSKITISATDRLIMVLTVVTIGALDLGVDWEHVKGHVAAYACTERASRDAKAEEDRHCTSAGPADW